MLTPEYLRDLPNSIVQMFYQVEDDILADMARRIVRYDGWTASVDWQNERLRETGLMQEDILGALERMSGRTRKELKKLMEAAGAQTLRSDSKIYTAGGLHPQPSERLTRILNAGYRATVGEMQNLCRTTAKTAAKQFEDTLDRCWLQVQSGAFDLNTALQMAVENLSAHGISAIRYPSGRTDSIETAVRRAVQTGVNQTCGQLQDELAEEVGCDLVEVSAHAGARPEHALWQGKIYSRSGKNEKYPDFRSSTGYGTGAGLCGWNCRRSFGPYIEGSPPNWTEQELEALNEPKYEYDGRKLTEYEASQLQRANEREIRRWKRECAALDAGGLDTSRAAARLKSAQERQLDFLRKTGRTRQYNREYAKENEVAVSGKSAIIKSKETKGGTNVKYVAQIDIEKYRCISPNVTTDKVIVTDVQIEHIRQRHPEALAEFERYANAIIEDPDYILENKPNTGLLLKEIEENNKHYQLVLRLCTPDDPVDYSNSVITFTRVREKEWRRLLKNKKILYKKE